MYAGKAGLKAKIVVAMLLAGLLPLFGYAVTNYIMVSEDMEQLAKSQISSLSDIKNQQIKDYIDEVNKQVITLAENTMTINSAEAFTNAFNKITDQSGLTEAELQINIKGLEDYYENQFGKKLQDQTGESIDTKSLIPDNEKVRIAQSLYISSNQYPLGEKDRLDAAEDNSLYSQLHEAYHPIYRSLLKRYGYYDVFLADAESGNIVYSVYKELDFGTSLKDGPYSKSNIGKVFNLAKNGSQGESYIADFEPYLPSYNANAWFIGTPLHKNGKLIGVLIFQLPVERIDSILAKSVDAESHLSAYIVDRDKNIISQTGLGVVKSEHMVNQSTMDIALLGEKGFSIGKNIYGTDVVSAYSPIQVDSLDWTLLVEEPTSSVYAPVHELEMAGLLIGLAGSGFIFLAAFFLSKGVLKQLGADPGVLSVIADAIAAEKWQEVDDITTGKKQNLGVFASMLTMKGNLESRIENERKAACENQRILQALDNVTSSVIVTDVDYNVIYHNKAFSDLVEVRREGFSHLINGVDSQRKHIVPSSRLHDELRNTTSLDKLDSKSGSKDLQENGFHAHITGSPVRSEQGEIIGGVFEWTDRTDSVRIEQEIQSIVDNAMQGDLSGRIATTELTGFLERLSSGINQLVDVNEKSISEAIVSLSAIAEGDLTKPVESEYSGIFGKLANDINTTITVLSRVVSEIGASSTTVLEASNEILEDNNQLSQRTEMQASNLEETASSMEEITTTVKQNSFNAGKANTVASEAKNTAEGGASVVKQAVSAMNDISSSSKEMVDIIGVIDEIAFQTNLLALNAAVEAARAGEQGRGFAVVASEVRNLAGRSAVAAKEIKELIQKSVDKVSEGSRLVNDSGQTLEEIILSVKEVSDIVAEIALASTEQSDGISQVNIAVSQMDEMTQKNASMVEQSVAASESMKNQAHRLNELLSFFQDGAVKPAQLNSNIYGGEERRAEVRPWSNQKPLQSQKSAVDRITSDDSHYDDGSEWAQF